MPTAKEETVMTAETDMSPEETPVMVMTGMKVEMTEEAIQTEETLAEIEIETLAAIVTEGLK